jgi:hypothetical protein
MQKQAEDQSAGRASPVCRSGDGAEVPQTQCIATVHELTRLYVKEIHNRMRIEISDEDLALALVDSKVDVGCDLIHTGKQHAPIERH